MKTAIRHAAFSAILAGATALCVTLSSGTAVACPDWGQSGTALEYSSDTLYMPQSLDLLAGGENQLLECDQPGMGFVATAPDVTLTFTDNGAGRDLVFRVDGACDTLMLVNDAAGAWHFNDDYEGIDPLIRLANASEGVYDIWVGTFGGDLCDGTLILETF